MLALPRGHCLPYPPPAMTPIRLGINGMGRIGRLAPRVTHVIRRQQNLDIAGPCLKEEAFRQLIDVLLLAILVSEGLTGLVERVANAISGRLEKRECHRPADD